MTTDREQPLLHLDLDAIGPIDEVAFEMAAPDIDSTAFTICFWFYAESAPGTRVMANVGNERAEWEGWSALIRDDRLVFRAWIPGAGARETSCALTDADSWHHFTGIVDRAAGEIRAHLDGSARGWRSSASHDPVEPASIRSRGKLIIGGYTDAAGGHIERRFGRLGTGFIDDFRLYRRALGADEIASFVPIAASVPTAAFAVQPGGGEAPLGLHFDATPSRGTDGAAGFLWDFGDGTLGRGRTVSHDYRYAGRYRVRLMVIDRHHRLGVAQRDLLLAGEPNPLEIRSLFVNGSEGYACFRIPAIVRAENGDLVAFAEGRIGDCSDATPVIHIVCKRSRDQGRSWQPLQVVARNVVSGVEYGCMNPSPVVDTLLGSKRIVVVFNKLEVSEWKLTEGEGVSRVCCVYSDDHGLTWSEDRDITLQVHRPYNPRYLHVYPGAAQPRNREADWRKQVPTLGHAIQLRGTRATPGVRGRLFYIGCRTEGPASVFSATNYAFWSDDLGESWQIGGAITVREDGSSARGLNEATAVELEDGSLLINSRAYQDGKPVGKRAVTMGSFDSAGRIRFGAVRHDQTLIDSGVQASLIRLPSGQLAPTKEELLVFANPAHPSARLRMTVRLSRDRGRSWPVSRLIDPGPSAYSDLVVVSEATLGLVYERGNRGGIAFVALGLDWLAEELRGLPSEASPSPQ